MPEPHHPLTVHRSAPISLLLAVALLAWPSSAAPTAAADELDWSRPVPSPTRSGEAKGSGQPLASQPTGRLIVRYAEGTSEADRARARASAGLERVDDVALPNAELVEPAGDVAAAIARLDADAAIVSAEPEYRRTLAAGPTGEPRFGEQWALHNTGQTIGGFVGVPDVDMNVPEAWEITTGSPSVIVAVLDDGVDFSHPDLAARAWVNDDAPGDGIDNDGNGFVDDVNGWDFCNDDNTVHDADDFHGTHVAGSIAGSGNGTGIAGVAPSVQIMAVKFISDDPSCATDQQAIDAIEYAAANGAEIINASWGGADFSSALSDSIAAIPGVLVVAAAGNENSDNDLHPVFPASYDLPNILSVASVNNEGFLSDFTNFGFESVDLSAPGEDILSSAVGGGWEYLSGTSMAAANASGVAALAASVRPELLRGLLTLRDHLIATAKALPSTLGWVAAPRLLDARAAVVSRPDIRRLSGSDRYATAAAISAATFTPGMPYLFIATGENFPDALAGGALAAQLGSPLLLVRNGSIPDATNVELVRLRAREIFVLGGPSAVSDGVVAQLRSYASTQSVVRMAGANRYATAAAISAGFAPGVPNVFIATGQNFPDALAGVPASAALSGPLLLVASTAIPAATHAELVRLAPQRIVILGGSGVISDEVAYQLEVNYTGGVLRVSGANRFETAAAVTRAFFPRAETVYVANGLNFPDALAGGSSAGAFGGTLLLVTASASPPATLEQVQRLQPARIFVLGGPAVVSDDVINQINALFP